jgi:hypothetical protein
MQSALSRKVFPVKGLNAFVPIATAGLFPQAVEPQRPEQGLC